MCGIFSIVDYKKRGIINQDLLKKSINVISYRGPDGSGFYLNKNKDLGLAHVRLAIIDLKTGDQPIFNETKEVVIVCNGEIYDFEKLRKDLEKRGHKFHTKSDTEVIVHLYEEYSFDFFKHLRGEFSFIIYDQKNNYLLAVRDRFGIKPLFYTQQNNFLILASEVKAIFASRLVERKLDIEALRNNLSLVMDPQRSYFKNIKAVPPGSYLKLDLSRNKLEIKKYWDLNLPKKDENRKGKSFDDYKNLLKDSFDQACKLRLRADVPVGIYLSGGLDSSAVAGTVAEFYPYKIKAFCISFSDPRFDEKNLSRKTADFIGADFHLLYVDEKTLLNNLEKSLWHSEIPVTNLHGVAKFLLSKLTSNYVKVVLTGEGGDELFLGYDYFKKNNTFHFLDSYLGKTIKGKEKKISNSQSLLNKIGFIPLNEMNYLLSQRGQKFINWLFRKEYRNLLEENQVLDELVKILPKDQIEKRDEVIKKQYFSIKGILAPYILVNLGDRQEMAHSVEGRVPLLDHHLFETIKEIPIKYKIKGNQEKYIFREAMKERIIKEVYQGEKWQFMAPTIQVKKGINKIMDDLINEYLSKRAIEEAKIFNPKAIPILFVLKKLTHFNKRYQMLVNNLLMFILSVQILNKLFVKNRW